MKSFLKYSLLILTLLLIPLSASAYIKPDVYTIDATKNAFWHNNLGLRWLDERCYYAAIQEFKIAISLAPNTQASSVYYKNLGDTYMTIGYPDGAQDCYEKAIKFYSLNFQYYMDLAKCLKARNIDKSKLKAYYSSKNPLNQIMVGLLKEENGDIRGAIITLDSFANTEPDLLITPAVKQHIKELVKQINSR